MALRALTDFFWPPPPPFKCYANCENSFDFQSLIVTKCNHIFCKACLEGWFKQQKTCPLDKKALAAITDSNVRQDENDSCEGMQYTSFKLYLERFTNYIQNDFSALQKKLKAANVLKISSCALLKKVKPKPELKQSDECSICKNSLQMYFITKDEDETKIGRFMHEDCWQRTVSNTTELLEISAVNVVEVAQQLPALQQNRVESKKPVEPISPIRLSFFAIILPVSIGALAMNSRLYHSRNPYLFVLSLPALIILKILSLSLSGLRAILSEKRST
ncbi:MAG TPA: RING finger protein [Rhabdochlamydiaceae bacterium]|nr:RING finger protein [Rhabdochlamydiaceae bacterium]